MLTRLVFALSLLALAGPALAAQPVTINNAGNTASAQVTGAGEIKVDCTTGCTGGGAVTISGPLARQADAASVAVGLSNEDVAILQSAIPPGTNTIGNVNVVTNNAATGLIQATASVPITFTAAGGPTQIIAANGSTKIYITHIDYVLSGAGTFALITGTGTNCGTGTTYLEGASGHPLSYAANGGISAGSGIGPIYVTGAGGEICAITTGAVDTSGHIAYAQF